VGHEQRKRALEELTGALRSFLSASEAFDEALGTVLGLNPTDVRCVDLLDQYGTMTAGALAEVAGLSTGAVTFVLDRLEGAGMVTRRRDTEDRRRVWVEIVPEARQRLQRLQQPVAEEMRQVAQRFKADELAVVRDFMRQAKEVFQRQVYGANGEGRGALGREHGGAAAPEGSPEGK